MDFLAKTPEAPALNQYWYSERTIAALVEELASGRCGKRVAFLSTPSVYFSLPETSAVRQNSYCFDLDEQWADDPRFRRFDFNAGRAGTFDCCVVDPPFITRDVWEAYARCVRSALRQEGGRVLLTTVGENEAMLRAAFGERNLRKTEFMPAMRSGSGLPYQYSLFVNYAPAEASPLARWNPDVPDEFRAANARRMPDVVAAAPEAPIAGTSLSFEALLERELAREAAGV